MADRNPHRSRGTALRVDLASTGADELADLLTPSCRMSCPWVFHETCRPMCPVATRKRGRPALVLLRTAS